MPLTEQAQSRWKQRGDAVQQRIQQGGGGKRYFNLSGQKNAIVEPGKSVVVRLLPRWDIAQAYVRDKAGKVVVNPKYDLGQDVFVEAFEHWFDGADGKRHREWCRTCLGESEPCPLCDAVETLFGGDEADKEASKDIRRKEMFLFNAVVRTAGGKTLMREDGKPDIRVLLVPGTVFVGIKNIVLGAGQEGFARGEVWDWTGREGCDLAISRPAKGVQGVQYSVQAAPKCTPLFAKDDAAAWAGWMGALIDLEAEVSGENVKSYADLYQGYYGRPPEEGPRAASPGGTTSEDTAPEAAGVEDWGFGSAPAAPEAAAPSAAEDFPFGDLPGDAPPAAPPARRASATPTRTAPGKRR